MQKKILIVMLCGAAGWLAPAVAEDIYRCGDSYSQRPCAGGRLVPADDARSASQSSQTRAAVQRDAKAADAMEKARLKAEANAAQAVIPPPKAAEPLQEPKPVAKAKARKPPYFTAVSRKSGEPQPSKKKAKAKAQKKPD